MSSLEAHVKVLASMKEEARAATVEATNAVRRDTMNVNARCRAAYAEGYRMGVFDAFRAARDALEEQKESVRARVREALEIAVQTVEKVEGSHTSHETESDNEGEGSTK